MDLVYDHLAKDQQMKHHFFDTIFLKMHFSLQTIEEKNFKDVEFNIQVIEQLLNYEGASHAFVDSPYFCLENTDDSLFKDVNGS